MRAAEFRLWLGRAVWVALLIWGFGGGNAQDAICIQDDDCPAGQYCFSDTCDSGEGWQHPCSRCSPCDTCQCNADSLAGACPKSRCPGSPNKFVDNLAGTFVSVAEVDRWGGDLCVTLLTFMSNGFEHRSFRISRQSYEESATDRHPVTSLVLDNNNTLCDWPDAPGPKSGLVQNLGPRPGSAARLILTYYQGAPQFNSGQGARVLSQRVVDIIDDCPRGVKAMFSPWHYVPTFFVKPPWNSFETNERYRKGSGPYGWGFYIDGEDGCPDPGQTTFQGSSDGTPAEVLRCRHGIVLTLGFPATGDATMGLKGIFHGEFLLGSSRTDALDPGYFPGVKCKSTFVISEATGGMAQFEQHTYGCTMHDPVGVLSLRRDLVGGVASGGVASSSIFARKGFVDYLKDDSARPGGNVSETFLDMHLEGEGGAERTFPSNLGSADHKADEAALPRAAFTSAEDKAGVFGGHLDVVRAATAPAGSQRRFAMFSCPPGSLATYEGAFAKECELCPVGRYKDVVGNSPVCLACPPALTTIDTGSTSDRCCKPDGLRILEQAETRLDVDPNEVTAESLQDCSYACTSRLSIPGSGSLCGSVELYFEKEGTGLAEIHFLGGNASASFSLGGGGRFDIDVYSLRGRAPDRLQRFNNTLMKLEISRNSSDFSSAGEKRFAPVVVSPSVTVASFASLQSPLWEVTLADFFLNEGLSQLAARAARSSACTYEDVGCMLDHAALGRIMNGSSDNNFTRTAPGEARPTGLGLRIKVLLGHGAGGVHDLVVKQVPLSQLCAPGTFSATRRRPEGEEGSQSCASCPAGSFAPTFGHRQCVPCPQGTASGSGAVRCELCPPGLSTVATGSRNLTKQCIPFCPSGYFSPTGLQPCEPCPAGLIQPNQGSKVCEACPEGWWTPGNFAGSTGRGSLACIDTRDRMFLPGVPSGDIPDRSVPFGFEEVYLRSTRFVMTVAWKIPAYEADPGDMIGIFYGDPFTSVRQLQWAYTSALSTCDATVDAAACKTPGTEPVPWGSRKFELESAGAGRYGAVLFSKKRRLRILGEEWVCVNNRVRDVSGNPVRCPADAGQAILRAGIHACPPGEFSFDGNPPCTRCAEGFAQPDIQQTSCGQCPAHTFSGPRGYEGSEQCKSCPESAPGTFKAGSVEDECMTCEELAQGNPSSLPPLCAPPTTPAPTVEIVETTTPPPRTICGNGVYNGVEECDDGNKINGDGCNLLCEVEEGFRCWNRTDETGEGLVRGDCRPICGDGYWEPVLDGEQCDDGNSRGGDGCTDCNIDRRYFCEGLPGETSKCDKLPVCGDGVREWKKGERCDDGNIINGDGCSSVCVVEPGYICTNFTAEEDICCATLTLCGNGQLEACERCDDGNLEDGDGCSSTCAVEKSFFCQNGCSGPLCGRQEGCKDSRTLPMKQDFTMDIFRWLGVEVAGLIRSDGTVNFEILADALSRGLVAGSNSGLLLELIHGPFAINAVSMYSSSYVRGSVDTITKDMLFQSLLSRVSPINGYTFSGLTRTFCSSNGKVRLDWINGSISEQSGPLMNDETCEIYLSAGFAEQDAITDPRAVEIRVVSVALRSIHEYIVIENLRGTVVNITYDQNGAPPFVVRGLAPVMVRYNFKSLRSDGSGWYTSDMGGLRLEMTYAALKVQEKALVCVNFECKNEPACVNEKNCLAENTMYFDPAELRGFHSKLDAEPRVGQLLRSQHASAPGALWDQASADIRSHDKDLASLDQQVALRRNAYGHLTASISVRSGSDAKIPSAFSQTDMATIIPTEQQEPGTGFTGEWSGTCSAKPLCSERDPLNCVMDYGTPGTSCQVRLFVDGMVIKEFRSGCGTETGLLDGFSVGVIMHLDDRAYKLVAASTRNVQLIFRRFIMEWTQSNNGRSGKQHGLFTYGVLESLPDPGSTIPRKLDIMLQPFVMGSLDPVIPTNGAQSFVEKPGGCQLLRVTPAAQDLIMRPADFYTNGADIINDLLVYRECNNSFSELKIFADASSECSSLWSTFMAREALSLFPDLPLAEATSVCASTCWAEFSLKLSKASTACTELWKTSRRTAVFDNLLFKKVVILRTAYYWSKVVCFSNAKGLPCLRPTATTSVLERACPAYSLQAHFLDATVDLSPFSGAEAVDTCPKECYAAMMQHQREEGCCAALVAREKRLWAQDIASNVYGGGLTVDLGNTSNPWSPLGDGTGVQFRMVAPSSACEQSNLLNVDCMMKRSCNSRNWVEPCCAIYCYNGGAKSTLGACYCQCQPGFAGPTCKIKTPLLKFSFVIEGESLETFDMEKQLVILDAISLATFALPEQIERDSIVEENLRRRARRAGSRVIITVRIRAEFERQIQRFAQKLKLAIDEGDFKDFMQNVSSHTDSWTPTIQVPENAISVYKSSGASLCDDIVVMCERSNASNAGAGGQDTDGDNRGAELSMILGSAGVTFFFCMALLTLRFQLHVQMYVTARRYYISIFFHKDHVVKLRRGHHKFQYDENPEAKGESHAPAASYLRRGSLMGEDARRSLWGPTKNTGSAEGAGGDSLVTGELVFSPRAAHGSVSSSSVRGGRALISEAAADRGVSQLPIRDDAQRVMEKLFTTGATPRRPQKRLLEAELALHEQVGAADLERPAFFSADAPAFGGGPISGLQAAERNDPLNGAATPRTARSQRSDLTGLLALDRARNDIDQRMRMLNDMLHPKPAAAEEEAPAATIFRGEDARHSPATRFPHLPHVVAQSGDPALANAGAAARASIAISAMGSALPPGDLAPRPHVTAGGIVDKGPPVSAKAHSDATGGSRGDGTQQEMLYPDLDENKTIAFHFHRDRKEAWLADTLKHPGMGTAQAQADLFLSPAGLRKAFINSPAAAAGTHPRAPSPDVAQAAPPAERSYSYRHQASIDGGFSAANATGPPRALAPGPQAAAAERRREPPSLSSADLLGGRAPGPRGGTRAAPALNSQVTDFLGRRFTE